MIMTLILSVFYIAWFTHHCLIRFAPCFAAASGAMSPNDARVRRASKVSLAFIAGAIAYSAAWAIVLATTIAVMYGG